MKKAQSLKTTIRYAAYLRCSTDDQAAGDYTTIDTQREINTRHVAESGGVLVGEYSDEGKTGTNLKRKGYRDLLRDAEAGKFDAVCCTYMSRLARGEAHSVAEWQLKEAGIRIEYVKEKFTDDMAGYVNKQMTRVMDGMYPKMVREWTVTKMTEMFGQGYFVGGGIPFGYCTVEATDSTAPIDKRPRRMVPAEADVPPVVRAFELFVATRSATPVLEYLRDATGAAWSYDRVMRLLRNRVYIGEARWRGLIHESRHPAIVDRALFDAAQEIAGIEGTQNRARKPKDNTLDTTCYYLRGLVRCAACGSAMTPMYHNGRKTPVRYYECIQAMKFGAAGCPVKRVNAQMLHESVLWEIERLARYPSRLAGLLREAAKLLPRTDSMEKERQGVIGRLRVAERQVERLTDAVAIGGNAVMPLVRRMEALEAERFRMAQELLRLERAIAAAKVQRPDLETLQGALRDFRRTWEDATEAERAYLMSLAVGGVEMTAKGQGHVSLLLCAPLLMSGNVNQVRVRDFNAGCLHNADSLKVPLTRLTRRFNAAQKTGAGNAL